jgi:hypothetical protein
MQIKKLMIKTIKILNVIINIYFGCLISDLIGLAINDERIIDERGVDELD